MAEFTDRLQRGVNFVFQWIPRKRPSPDLLRKVKLVAHRGAWKNTNHIENTLPAFDACLGHKIWAIEFDVRWTADDIPVVHHDATLERLFADPRPIRELTAVDLRSQYPDIPTLSEVVDRYHKHFHLMIEMKDPIQGSQKSIIQNILTSCKPVEDFHLMSLKPTVLETLDFFPKQSLVSIGRLDLKDIFRWSLEWPSGGLTGQYLLFSQKMLKNCRAQGISTGTGFPSAKNLMFREIHRGVDWIFTNDPLLLSCEIPD